MSSEAILDFEQLLAPISDDAPAGGDIREDASPTSLYYQVKDARSQARARERNEVIDDESAATDISEWRTIQSVGPEIIANHSKDVEVCAWLIEALVRTHGFAGLRDGFRLVSELVQHFKDDLYPRPDEDGISTTLAALSGLSGLEGDGTLLAPIRQIQVIDEGDDMAFAFWHYEQACSLSQIQDPEKRDQRVASGVPTIERMQMAANQVHPDFISKLRLDLKECQATFDIMCTVLDDAYGQDSPPYSKIKNSLSECEDAINFLFGAEVEALEDDEDDEAATDEGAESSGSAASSSRKKTLTREDAFKTLLTVAEYFRRTEPHSPVSYLLEQAVRWGRMPLPELAAELISDANTRQQFFSLTGIRDSTEQQ